jgi:hypothetical protein
MQRLMNKYSSVDIETGYGLNGQGSIPGKGKNSSFFGSDQNGSGTHTAKRWVPGAVSLGIKRPDGS